MITVIPTTVHMVAFPLVTINMKAHITTTATALKANIIQAIITATLILATIILAIPTPSLQAIIVAIAAMELLESLPTGLKTKKIETSDGFK
jgi:hypothetical protein